MSFGTAARDTKEDVSEKRSADSPASLPKEKRGIPHGDVEVNDVDVITDRKTLQSPSWFSRNRGLVRCIKLCALAALILGWWISATTLPATRHRWIVQTFWAWSFIAIIAFRFIPNSVVTRPVEAVWIPLVQRPFFLLPKYVRYSLGWLAFVGIVVGCAFGFKLESVSLS
jgi:CNT family concentrative nucleoside transporter